MSKARKQSAERPYSETFLKARVVASGKAS